MTYSGCTSYAMIVAYEKKGNYSVNPGRTILLNIDNLTSLMSSARINKEKF